MCKCCWRLIVLHPTADTTLSGWQQYVQAAIDDRGVMVRAVIAGDGRPMG